MADLQAVNYRYGLRVTPLRPGYMSPLVPLRISSSILYLVFGSSRVVCILTAQNRCTAMEKRVTDMVDEIKDAFDGYLDNTTASTKQQFRWIKKQYREKINVNRAASRIELGVGQPSGTVYVVLLVFQTFRSLILTTKSWFMGLAVLFLVRALTGGGGEEKEEEEEEGWHEAGVGGVRLCGKKNDMRNLLLRYSLQAEETRTVPKGCTCA